MKRILLPIALLLFYAGANAQQAFTNNGNLQIHTGASVNGFGSFTNTSGASFTNNGSFYVRGDVSNDQPSMATGTGTLYLNGSVAQVVGGTQTFKTYNLVTNNASGITLNNNLSASGLHTFTAGHITTSATPNYMVYEAGASYSGDNDARHVTGWVKKLGNSDFTFPVGNGTYERTIALTNLTALSEFDARYFDGPTPNIIALFSPLVLVDENEYWRINKISGANARVAMNWDNSKVAVPQVLTSNIRAAYYNNSFWASIGGSGTGNVATTGSVTSNSVSAFNNTFTLGSTAYVLPLSIVNFTGNRSGNYNALRWTIHNEVNVQHYELQRSNDAVNFTSINIQAAKNNGAAVLYNYDDVAAMQSKVFYRLKCIDNNGQIKYSGIVIIEQAHNSNKEFYVVKNPVQDEVAIYASANLKGSYNYTLANSSGQVVQSGVLSIPYAGIHTIALQTNLPKGIYLLLLHNEQNVLQKSILKE
jgi:hypothetical protein